jgi:adenosine deaminase
VRDSTIIDLLRNECKDINDNYMEEEAFKLEMQKYRIAPNKTMDQCFAIFGLLHQLLKKKENLIRVTREILSDFSEENTVYLELRTTPRNIYENEKLIVSKREYIETIINEIRLFEATNNSMITRLILSVDRTKGYEDAYDTVQLCKEMYGKYVVGKIQTWKN